MSKLDPRIEVIRETYGLDASDFWELPQKKGTWVAKHSALEVAAAKAGITFDNPIIIEANSEAGIAVLSTVGTMGERREWATGEASPKNNKNAYPWAMAEKRAKDRVILKLIGIHGLVYSEDEMSGASFERDPVPENVPLKSSAQAKRDGDWPALQAEIDACQTLEELNLLVASKAWLEAVKPLPRAWVQQIRDYVQTCRDDFARATPAPRNPNDQFDRMQGAQQ
jgi:hypothetical protein